MNRSTGMISLRHVQACLLILFTPAAALAHNGVGPTGGFASGFAHPLLGLDHFCAMIAVGLWATQRGGRAIWLVPACIRNRRDGRRHNGRWRRSRFRFVEPAIIASVLVLGVLVAAAAQLPLVASILLVGLFAFFHGYAHGSELPSSAAATTYAVGFIASTVLLHICGIALGLSASDSGQLSSFATWAARRCLRLVLSVRVAARRLEPPQRQPAVDVEHVAGGVGEVAAGEHGDGPADVFRFAPAVFDREAVRDQPVVFLGDRGAHVGVDDARAALRRRRCRTRRADGPRAAWPSRCRPC